MSLFFSMYLCRLKPKSCADHKLIPIVFEIKLIIFCRNISSQVGVSHAERTPLALVFFWLTPLNKFLSQILVRAITS